MAGRHGPAGPFIKGLFFVALVGIFISRGTWGWHRIIPLLVIGFILFAGNVVYTRKAWYLRKKRETEQEEQDERLLEKQVLKAAKKNGGFLTPALAAVDSSLSIERAETVLQSFVKRGYASMEITDSGQIEYCFAEFLPPAEA